MKKRSMTLGFSLLLCGILQAETEFFGYFENRLFLIENPSFGWNEFSDKFKLGDYNRLRLNMKATPSKKVAVNLALDIYSFHGALTSPLGTYEAQENGSPQTFRIDPDRIYIDLYFKHFDLSVGKQRVALGVSYIWAPLDIFNRVNLFEPKEEKPGTNAVKLYIPLGASSNLTGVFSPDEDFKTSKSALRFKSRLANIDAGLTLIRRGDNGTTIYGLDLRGENFIGWWLEYGYFTSPQGNDSKLVLGFDYTFPVKNGLYWLNEFYYDSGGAYEIDQYDYQARIDGERFTLGRTYLLSMLRYGFSDFFNISLSYIGNWGDGSYLINPMISLEIFQNVSISSGLYIPMGNRRGEFNTNRRNLFFVWLKVNF